MEKLLHRCVTTGCWKSVFTMAALPFPKLQEYQLSIIGFQPLPISVTNFLILGLMNVCCVIATLILKFISGRNIPGMDVCTGIS